MTATELQKRNERAQQLRVLKTDDNSYYVESSDQKICYKVTLGDEGLTCVCGDYARGVKTDPDFKCKHILAVTESADVKGAEVIERKRPKLDERFLINIHGKDFVLYAGLLDLAHQKGLLKLDVTPIQYPSKENNMEAICLAVAESKYGESFKDIGDANPLNTDKTIAKHILRMASTRAKSRALRDFVNVGMTAFEELGSLDEVVVTESSEKPAIKRTIVRKVETRRPEEPREQTGVAVIAVQPEARQEPAAEPVSQEVHTAEVAPVTTGKKKQEGGANGGMSEAQKRAIYNLSRRRGLSVDELQNYVKQRYNVDTVEELKPADASAFIRILQTSN